VHPISSSSGTLCISISNGSIVPVPEATQTGGFDNSSTALLPFATLTTTTTNIGQSLVGAPTHALPTVTYTATAQNGFNTTTTATLALAVSFQWLGHSSDGLVEHVIYGLDCNDTTSVHSDGNCPFDGACRRIRCDCHGHIPGSGPRDVHDKFFSLLPTLSPSMSRIMLSAPAPIPSRYCLQIVSP